MGGQALRLGPFVGGLNTVSDPTAIADAELAESSNFELDIDGSLVSRPPIQEIDGHYTWTERIICIAEAVFSGTHYLIGSNINGVYYRPSGANQSWNLITDTIRSTCAVQYADALYIVAITGAANPGGKWTPGGGFTAVAAIPKGMACTIHKERLFIVPGVLGTTNASRVSFSNAGNFETWGGSDFIDVKQGDGSNLIDLTVFQDNLILFKNRSTHVLAYDTRPADAVLREISRTIGVDRQFNMVNYENQIYIFHGGWVYEIVNYDFNRLNTKVPFIVDDTAPGTFTSENVFISLLGDRLVCRFHRNIYVYGMRTRTWSEWESVNDALHYFGPIQTLHPPTGNEYYAGSCISTGLTCVQLLDKPTSSSLEAVLNPLSSISRDTFTRTVSNGWGSMDTGEAWTTSGGAAADFSVTGTQGRITHATVNVNRFANLGSISRTNWDYRFQLSMSQLMTGADFYWETRLRFVNGNNNWGLRVSFDTSNNVNILVFKTVSGVITNKGNFTLGAYTAGELFNLRFYLNGSAIKAKIWRSSAVEPGSFQLSFVDTDVAGPGSHEMLGIRLTGNTNVNPFTLYDNVVISDPTNVNITITALARTKNFDMATSHTFKRLWWWGADVTTDNDIVGIATPIVFSFNVTWDMLATKTWSELGTWGQPLTTIAVVQTTQQTETGTSRRFAKFLKGLRYRQINFAVRLTTEGSTVDGPARLFTMTIFTESKETVTKGVN